LIGSGGGIAQVKAKTVDFGSTDAPLKPEDLAAAIPGGRFIRESAAESKSPNPKRSTN